MGILSVKFRDNATPATRVVTSLAIGVASIFIYAVVMWWLYPAIATGILPGLVESGQIAGELNFWVAVDIAIVLQIVGACVRDND